MTRADAALGPQQRFMFCRVMIVRGWGCNGCSGHMAVSTRRRVVEGGSHGWGVSCQGVPAAGGGCNAGGKGHGRRVGVPWGRRWRRHAACGGVQVDVRADSCGRIVGVVA